MDRYSRSGLADASVLRNLKINDAANRTALADLLADLGEADERQLYREAAYSTLHEYCVEELNWTDDSTYKRVRVAAVARQFPAIFHAIADGRLNLSGVLLLKSHLTPESVDELIAAASRKTRRQIQQLLADRAPKPDLATRITRVQLPAQPDQPGSNLAPGPMLFPAAKLEPLGARRVGLQVMLAQETSDLLERAQQLLGHQQCGKDVARVLHRALELLVEKLEKKKYARTDRPRAARPQSQNPRTIPAAVRRAVRERDGDQCTFICADTGRRCEARSNLQFDHIVPIARGGTSTLPNLRLLCGAHNQLEAERMFGRAFMDRKRSESDDPDHRDLVSALHGLGYRATEAIQAAAHAMCGTGLSLEDRMRTALAFFRPKGVRIDREWGSGAGPTAESVRPVEAQWMRAQASSVP